MNLYFHKDWRGNFGDDLNHVFFDCIWPNFREVKSHETLYGIGTLLNNQNGIINNSIIFGSGFGYGEKAFIDSETCHIVGVRGPLTASALGLPESSVIGDPALYLPLIPELLCGKPLCPADKIVVAPHHRSSELWDFSKCSDDKFYFLDAGDTSILDYIATIRQASLVLTEAMHGAIACAAFGVPFYPVNIRGLIDPTKWNDFSSSVNLELGDFFHLHRPRQSLIRRVEISRLRSTLSSLGLVGRLGRAVDEKDRQLLIESIEKLLSVGMPCVVKRDKVEILQEKIFEAINNAQSIQ